MDGDLASSNEYIKSVAADVLKKKAGAGKSASVLPYSSGMYVCMHVYVCMYV